MRRLTPYVLLAVLVLGTGLGVGLGLSGAPSPSSTTDICMSYRQPSRSGIVCEPKAGSGTVMTTKGPLCPQSLVRKADLEPMVHTTFSCYLGSVSRKL